MMVLTMQERKTGKLRNEVQEEFRVLADELMRWLIEDCNCVRISPTEVSGYRTRWDICDHLGISIDHWSTLKNWMLANGYDICYDTGRNKGHFAGGKDERVTNFVKKAQIAEGWIKHRDLCYKAIKESSPEAKAWIKARYPNFRYED